MWVKIKAKERKKKRRTRLFNFQNGLCCLCKKPMTMSRDGFKNGANPNNYATIEHLHSRFDLERKRGQSSPVMLSCCKCNETRGATEEKNLPLLEIWYRASNFGENLEFVPSNLKYLF